MEDDALTHGFDDGGQVARAGGCGLGEDTCGEVLVTLHEQGHEGLNEGRQIFRRVDIINVPVLAVALDIDAEELENGLFVTVEGTGFVAVLMVSVERAFEPSAVYFLFGDGTGRVDCSEEPNKAGV